MATPKLQPWQRTLRTVFQALVALAVMLPILVAETGLTTDQAPWLAGVLAAAAVITRIMATPAVEAFLQRFLPWLSAAGPTAAKRNQAGHVLVDELWLIILALAASVFAAIVLVAMRT